MSNTNELPIPGLATRDTNAEELLRVWFNKKDLDLSLRVIEEWPDPLAWGVVFAAITRHLGAVYQAKHGKDPEQTANRICTAFCSDLGFLPELDESQNK